MESKSPLRIFIGLVEVAGRNRALKWGFEQLGHPCTFLNLTPNPGSYGANDESFLTRPLVALAEARRRRRWLIPLLFPAELFFRIALFAQILPRHDVFIFSFGTSFLGFLDYRILRFLGKKIVCQFHGSDSRPPYLNGSYSTMAGFEIETCRRDTLRAKKRIDLIDRLAHLIIDIPPQGYFHTRPYLNRLLVGLPSGPFKRRVPASQSRGNEIRILHAPSNREYKGTEEIRRTIERLREKGLRILYREISGRPNEEVIAAICDSDLVIDQLYVDYALTGLPTEAAWQGRAVITAGYSGGLWSRTLPQDWTPPTVYCTPETFEAELEALVRDPARIRRLGQSMREFVETHHHPKAVAERYLQAIRGEFPSNWVVDPNEMSEVWGGFFRPRKEVQAIVRDLLSRFGQTSLMLDDKPKLKEAVCKWAREA